MCKFQYRLQELSVEIGGFNTIRAELQHEVEQLEEKNKTLENQNAFLEVCSPLNIILMDFDFILKKSSGKLL